MRDDAPRIIGAAVRFAVSRLLANFRWGRLLNAFRGGVPVCDVQLVSADLPEVLMEMRPQVLSGSEDYRQLQARHRPPRSERRARVQLYRRPLLRHRGGDGRPGTSNPRSGPVSRRPCQNGEHLPSASGDAIDAQPGDGD